MNNCCFKFNGQLFNFGDSGGCEGYEEVSNYAALPATGETGTIYKTLDDGKIYEWDGSAYIELVEQSEPVGATLMKTGQTVSYIKYCILKNEELGLVLIIDKKYTKAFWKTKGKF